MRRKPTQAEIVLVPTVNVGKVMEAVRRAHIIEGPLLLTTFFVKRHVLRGQDGMSGVHHVERMGQSFAPRGKGAGRAASTVLLVIFYL